MDRRAFLTRSAALGCSLAASPLVTPVSFAAAPGEGRLVVIILRGGMDGLGVVTPYGDPDFAALGRPAVDLAGGKAFDLDGRFALNGALAPLMPLWTAGELAFAHAVSTPYRNKRSHFDGQDLLEAGVPHTDAPLPGDGWLNRLLQQLPGATGQTAYAVGSDPFRILSGPAPASRWTPEANLRLSPQAIRLTEMVMQSDPAMASALASAFALAGSDGDSLAFSGDPGEMMAAARSDMLPGKDQQRPGRVLAQFTADRLREEARIACYSLTGWDTHTVQERNLGRALSQLSDSVLTLKDGLGPHWGTTAVVAVTEFGRTARWNGSGGTDHGTAGAMLLAGGALRGGRVIADWPGLNEAALFQGRDLMPARDLRAHLGWLMRGLFGVGTDALERAVFPGLDLGDDPGLLS
ncbi:DUF1501 domain-containing protein [Maliponia aquimaris]|uniref:Sulfatase n=1 Tax=Maliponia aquimaris TaxID=1673631 RepID=A0A238KVT5_9RHOB|nr:DUF1501 domain-containing protein [Maliponia aquimaris]SMX46905.1 hypothetical protein MAA8898_03555 [Maliponia aquimaris]